MFRRSVRSLEGLLERQQTAVQLLRRTAASASATAPATTPATTLAMARSLPSTVAARATHLSRFAAPFRAQTRRTFHSSRARRSHDSPKPGHAHASGEAAETLTLSQRLKKLSKEYGWVALGVYLGLSALDFPFCFLLVRTVGTDRIAAAEQFVIAHVAAVVPDSIKERYHSYRGELKEVQRENGTAPAADEHADEVEGWGVKEAEARVQHEASLGTQLALAYAIHKSFIFVRVPLTAAVLPKVVKVLRAWGWKIGRTKT